VADAANVASFGSPGLERRVIAPGVLPTHYDLRPGKASLAAAFGNYKGLLGLAVGLGYAVSDR
jgi:hypothetical protein